MNETTVDEVELSCHYIHWAICELAWNKETHKSLTIPIDYTKMLKALDSLKIKFVKLAEDECSNTVVTLGSTGLPTTYLGMLHGWIAKGTTEDNFSWQQRDGFDFTPLLEEHLRQMLEPNSSENFVE